MCEGGSLVLAESLKWIVQIVAHALKAKQMDKSNFKESTTPVNPYLVHILAIAHLAARDGRINTLTFRAQTRTRAAPAHFHEHLMALV